MQGFDHECRHLHYPAHSCHVMRHCVIQSVMLRVQCHSMRKAAAYEHADSSIWDVAIGEPQGKQVVCTREPLYKSDQYQADML